MCLGASPIPIGLTPGSLFSGIKRQVTNPETLSGGTDDVHKRRATPARASHKSTESFLRGKKRHHASASTPEGPAAHCVLFAACLMVSPVIR